MNHLLQTAAALLVVGITLWLLARAALRRARQPEGAAHGCGGGCACPSAKLKTSAK